MRPGSTAIAPSTLPAPEPRSITGSQITGAYGQATVPASSLDGASPGGAAPITDPTAAMWNTRWRSWRDQFTREIAPNAQLYWRLYRNFDDWAPSGPNGAWRDRTIPPTAFKIVETRLPRLVLSQFGGREWGRSAATDRIRRVQLKAMILLGLNCGFGNADCGMLPIAAVDLQAGWIDFPRPKTGIARRCPLWPETITALSTWLALRREKRDDYQQLVFITSRGLP